MNIYQLRKMQLADLDMVLQWRNHPFVRNNMFHQDEITMEDHHQWFYRLNQESGRHLLIFEENNTSLGFVNLEFIKKNQLIHWGFYKKHDAPKGIGRAMGVSAILYAFNRLKARKIIGEVLAFNHASLIFHRALGFRQEDTLKEKFFDGNTHHDIVVFGLLADEALIQEYNR